MKSILGSFLPAVDRGWKSMRTVCALATCQNKMFLRTVPQSRTGITVGEDWYCTVDCFVAASRRRLTALSAGRIMEMPHNPRLSIGLALLSKDLLTDDELRLAVAESELHGEELEVALVRLGLASEKQLAAARAVQWGYPVLGAERAGVPVEVDVPCSLLRTYSAVPLHYTASTKRLLLGFVYRVDHSFLQSLEQVTGCRAEPCFITPADFGEQMDRLMTAPDCEEVVYEDPGAPAQMAKTIGGFAVEAVAREATFAQCRNYIWVRLAGKRRKIDVLFQLKKTAEAMRIRNFALPKSTIGSVG